MPAPQKQQDVIWVNTPDGGQASFPKDMPKEQIAAILAKSFPAPMTTMEDVGQSAMAAVPKGIASIIGMPRDLGNALVGGAIYGGNRLFGATPEEATAAMQPWRDATDALKNINVGMPLPGLGAPGKEDVVKSIETVTGPLHQPQTILGEYADTGVQMVTGALALGQGGIVPRLIQGAVPALVSETTGQFTRQVAPEWEGPARTVSALASGLGANWATAPSSVRKVIADATRGVTPAQMDKAIKLVSDSNKPVGVPLTMPEAIQHVTNGRTTLDDVARFVENSRHGGPIMRPYFADRPQQVANAVQRQANAIDPVPGLPEVVGPQAQEAAKGFIGNINDKINKVTKPLYEASAPIRVNYRDMQKILANPSYRQKVSELRSDPFVGEYYKKIKANSVEMIDAVKKLMGKDIEALAMNPKGIDRFAEAAATQQKNEMVDIAKTASSDYDKALAKQAELRGKYLEPVENGPTGKIAKTENVLSQVDAIFPSNPAANSEQGVATAIKALSKKDPQLASNVVGAHIDRVFNEANQKLVSGTNQAGGAKFAAVIAGNSQQMKNLEAAIRSLPGGDSKWVGFRKLLDNLEATGRRKPQNSATSFNEMIKSDLQAGGPVGTTVATLSSPGRLTTRMMDSYHAWRLGRNTANLARLFTDPRAADELKRLAMMRSGTVEFANSVGRVISIIETPNQVKEQNRN